MRSLNNGQRFWTQHPMSFQFWDVNQPDQGDGVEGCVNIWPQKGYKWNDAPCSQELCFICENRNV